MKRRISITTKYLLGIVAVMLLNIILVFIVTSFQIESASRDAYKMEVDISATYIMPSFIKTFAIYEDASYLKAIKDSLENTYPYKLAVIRGDKLMFVDFLSQGQYESIEEEGAGTFNRGMKRYYFKIYDIGTLNFENLRVLVAKEIPMINKQMQNVLQLSLLAIVLISVPTISLLFFFFKRMSNQIVAVRNATIQIADGNFNEIIPVQSRDEIGDLASSINEMTRRLKQNESDRDAFLASVSHELRTPLTTLKANTKGILDEVIPPDQVNKYLLSNVEEIDRLTLMVNDLILASSFEQNKVLVKEITNLSDLLLDVTRQMEIIALQKDIKFSCRIEPGLERDVDRLKMKQVFVNVLDNAIKHSPNGSAITITAKAVGDVTAITVRDSGCGIEFEDPNNIFIRFCKGKKSSGLGLGMYISKLIVTAHEGEINAYNNPGVGATIEIVL